MPRLSTSSSRVRVYARNASACRPHRYRASIWSARKLSRYGYSAVSASSSPTTSR